MPARYYYKKFAINNDTTNQALFIFLDTSPFITQYYTRGTGMDNVRTQDTLAQKRWLETVLRQNNSPNIKWKIVAGHHPLFTGGEGPVKTDGKQLSNTFKVIFDKYGVDFYVCGHNHNLQYIEPNGKTHYIISGAAPK